MADLAEQVRTLPTKKIIVLLFVAALVITAGILLITWLQKADQQLLFANLSQEDAAAIVQKLNEQKIPYTMDGGGIMVPADKVYEVRLQLASQGLPQGGGVGFELFDKTSFTMTDFVQKLNYRRALQGELARTIRSLAEVEDCRIHLAVPEKTLFMQKDEKPKASVLLKLRTGRRLTSPQIQGIVHLVASSVEGLDPNDVSVVDNTGEMLTSVVDENFAVSSSQLEYQRNYEHEVETKVKSMLEPVVGKDKVKVRVATSFDFTKMEKTEERYDPDSQVARSEQRNIEKSTGATSGGVPGVATNLPGKQPPVAAQPGTPSVSDKKNETINYEISKTISHIISPTGEIKKLSAVVLVDGTYATAQGSTEKKYIPRTEDEVRQFEDMVKKAIGFSASRGDEVKVVNMPFDVTPLEDVAEAAAAPPAPAMPMVMMAAKYAIPLIGIVLLFLFVIKPLINSVTAPAPSLQQVALPQTVAEIQRTMAIPEKSSQDQLVDWAKKNPKDATNIVKGWLDDK
jgi:flagellar M-ring protein FliF